MKLKDTKKMAKDAIRRMGLKILRTSGRTFVVRPKPNFICMRFYAFIVTSTESEKLPQLETEGKLTISDWKDYLLQEV